jgi:ketosteroid isomerase-like protein
MLKNVFKYSLLIIYSFIFFESCSPEIYDTPEDVVNANLKYMNDENLSGVMSTIHSKSNVYSVTEDFAEKLFENYDLKYTIEQMEVTEQTETSAVVNFTQVTEKINGPDFKNNRITGQHIIKKEDDSWKIFLTQIYNTEYLN